MSDEGIDDLGLSALQTAVDLRNEELDRRHPVEVDYSTPVDPPARVRWLRRPNGELVLQELRGFWASRPGLGWGFVHHEWQNVEIVDGVESKEK